MQNRLFPTTNMGTDLRRLLVINNVGNLPQQESPDPISPLYLDFWFVCLIIPACFPEFLLLQG